MNQIGQTAQLTVTGILADGSSMDLSQRSKWTVYRTSNPALATVDENGLVTARGAGIVFITAVNEGATGVIRLRVVPGDPLTTLEGFVQLSDGTPVAGAEVSILNITGEATTDANGFFSIPGVPSQITQPLTVRAAVVIGGQSYVGSKQTEIPVPAGITDAGIITVVTTGGGLGPVLLSGMDPEDHGTPGQEMIRDFFLFVVGESAIHAGPSKIVMLGSSTTVGNTARNIATSVGYTLTQVTGQAILSVNFFDYDAIYMGSVANEVGGGITTTDLALINQRGGDIVHFVNSGGGLASFTQYGTGAYGWLKSTQPVQFTTSVGGSIIVTDAGQFFLSPSAVNVTPFHSGFTGPSGFFGLEVLATDSSANRRPLIIGGLANIPPDCNGNGIEDNIDIANGTSQDCNADGIPDSCQRDCNGNGIADACDIASGTSRDVVGPGALPDGIPDECQPDCNGNRIPDSLDISSGTSRDCNGNGIPDECEIANGTSRDCNGNGILDQCEIASGAARDCNGNGIPDACDIAAGTSVDVIGANAQPDGIPDSCQQDANGNLVPDEIDIANGTSKDCNGNGVPDESDIARGTSQDCNANGIPDECEPDCNGNGIADSCDIANGTSQDCNRNGIPDECDVLSTQVYEIRLANLVNAATSCGANGSRYGSSGQVGFTWTDTTGKTPVAVMVEFNVGVQCHAQGVQLATRLNGQSQVAYAAGPNFCSCSTTVGSKGTVQLTPSHYLVGAQNTFTIAVTTSFGFIPRTEWGSGVYARVTVFYDGDCNGNGIPDDCDIASGLSQDVIGAGGLPDGVPDECQLDCNGNGVPDEVDIAVGTSQDCNRNGIPDECDIAAGTSEDCNGNGIPDECELRTTKVYDVPLADLLNTVSDCGGGSRYGSSGQVGFRWNDAGAGQVTGVIVEFNVGVECHSVGAGHAVTLNGGAVAGFTTTTTFCSCSATPGTKVVLQPSPTTYSVGGQNTILIGITTSFGFIPRTEWGSGVYARITVEYSGGAQDCNNNGIPDSCDIAAGTSLDLNANGIPDECE